VLVLCYNTISIIVK